MAEITGELKTRFNRIAKSNAPSTGKSASYEEAVADFLKVFFDSYYEFHTRVQLLDHLLDVEDLFPGNLNEWDVVAVYRCAFPNGLLSPGAGKVIAYDSVAFVVQVAQDLTLVKLNQDLKRFHDLRRLTISEMGLRSIVYSSPYVAQRPLRILVYGHSGISIGTLKAELRRVPSGFDCLVVVEDDFLAVSPNNPFSGYFGGKGLKI
jgi:hypothetical protein